MKLLESSLNDKHEIINILREQLEQVKSINLDFVNDSQKNEIELKRLGKELDEVKESLSSAIDRNQEIEKKLVSESQNKSNKLINGLFLYFKRLENSEQVIKKKEELCQTYAEQIEAYKKKL